MSFRPVSEWSESATADFLAAYHQHTNPADLEDRTTDAVRAAALSHAHFGEVRHVGEVLVRAFTPAGSRYSVVQVILDDMPFLVDSLTALLSRTHRGVQRVVHPILFVERDGQGRLLRAEGTSSAGLLAESWTEFQINRLLTEADQREVERSVRDVLEQVIAVTTDWSRMQQKCLELGQAWRAQPPAGVSAADAAETTDLLEWLADNHLTFLGYRYYNFDATGGHLSSVDGTGLGLLKNRSASSRTLDGMPAAARELLVSNRPLVLTKSSQKSSVHRNVYMDYFGIKEFDASGNVIGEHRFLGLLSREAYSDSVLNIPVMRRVAQQVLSDAGALEGSHSYRDMLQFLETFPRDEMLQVDAQWLGETTARALAGTNRRGSQSFFHADLWGRFISVFIYLPRDVYNTGVRQRIEATLNGFLPASEIDSSVLLGESNLARVHLRVKLAERIDFEKVNLEELSAAISMQTQSWRDQFAEEVLNTAVSDAEAATLISIWRDAFSDSYIATYSPRYAVDDVVCMGDCSSISVRLVAELSDTRHVRIFNLSQPLRLSSLLPVLSAFGLDVIDEQPYLLHPEGQQEMWLHDLHFALNAAATDGWESRFRIALLECLNNEVETDRLLQLVVSADLSGRDVAILRTYSSYVSQWLSYGPAAVQSALIHNPAVAQRLANLFRCRFETADQPHAEAEAAQLREALDEVASLDHDRILRAIFETVLATMRTNAFALNADGTPHTTISLKIAPALISMMPLPHPYAEIWLDGPVVHGVHLRFGAVARGGLRWSDRRDDLRVEVMGLVRAQVVKNAVIVPTGAKGGFFPKSLPDAANRDAWMAAGIYAYQCYINALLDVTDNLVDGVVVKPTGVVCYDGDDPYLVVAADKGTATFSDIANEVSLRRGFWLGDAFASGGSVGYDHKAMGITARGAWESVIHHGQLAGIDVHTDPATVVGIGDMSGDVFGNGLLRSTSVRLVAAFDHRHIFIDPQPDAARSFQERERLFTLPRSSWADFDSTIISKGGGVYARSEKRIDLSNEARAALGIDADISALTPAELISHILRAPVDILWNGGIGTYVKATSQTHADVGDRANDAIRINGSELRCRIIGEGGNLGLTQLGRIEAALNGVRLNTDAIDNSAGVDTSDHEVNLKILVGLRRSLGYEERNELLRSMTDDVAELVLQDNIAQNEVLTLAHAQAHSMLTVHGRLIDAWEHAGLLNRKLESLPDDAELARRNSLGIGLTRPELSVLLAHAKISLTQELLAGRAINGDWAHEWLMDYFPERLRESWRDEIVSHPLRREIIATVIANRVINSAGITSVFRLTEETGLSSESAALALLSAMQISGLDDLRTELAHPDVSWDARIAAMLEARRYVDRIARWLLAHRSTAEQLVTHLDRLREVVKAVRSLIGLHLRGGELARWQGSAQRFVDKGMPQQLAEIFAGLLDEYAVLDLGDMAADSAVATEVWSKVYFEISETVGGDAILNAISGLPRQDRWQTMARAAMRADTYALLASLAFAVLVMPGDDRIERWSDAHSAGLARVRAMVTEISAQPVSDLAAISVALRMLRELVSQSS